MSITIIQKSDLFKPRRKPKVALVLASGAVSGAAFKLGGLVAMNQFLKNRKVTDFDIYVGVSAGSFIGSFIANGLAPEEVLRALNGTSLRLKQFKFYDFYWPDVGEISGRAGRLLRDAVTVWPSIGSAIMRHWSANREALKAHLKEFVAQPSYTTLENVVGPLVVDAMQATPLPHPGRYIPAGIFSNARLEQYVRTNLTRNHLPNDFRMLERQRGVRFYVASTNVNTARSVVFGPDADHTVSISEAVQASTAIPGFYTPPKIRGEEYMDGSVRKTAHASLAMHKGANLIIIYNPLRPYMNYNRYQLTPNAATLSDLGMGTVLNQTIRTMLQTRLYLGIEKLRQDPSFTGDIILIEPQETDEEFFQINPLAFWNRVQAARQGYESVSRSLEQNFVEVERIFAAYGMECSLDKLSTDIETFLSPTGVAPVPPAAPEPVTEDVEPRPKLSLVK